MSLNKFMHPRNVYRTPPNFKQLALAYPEFRKFAKQDLSGKVSIDFKDPGAVRTLTQCLLHRDFNLTVEIPPDRLVPTLPLRLNYLLWIEDIFKENSLLNNEFIGIDIGTGASCVYPLLAASHFKWKMLATELDEDSCKIALKNVDVNHLQNMITVKKVNSDTVLTSALDTDREYDFCMCNPPFFSSEMELDSKMVSRSPSRPLPHNAPSGSVSELVSPGGETSFIKRIIDDSVKLKTGVRVYTVMMGHKNSVKTVERFLKEADVCSIGTTEFCQGYTTRWAIAWTYDPGIVLRKNKKDNIKKNNTPFTFTVQLKLDSVITKVKELLSQTEVKIKIVKTNDDFCGMELTAEKNTWSKQRRKRRENHQNILTQKKEDEHCTNIKTSFTHTNTVDNHLHDQEKAVDKISEEFITDKKQNMSSGKDVQHNNIHLKRTAEDDGNSDSLKRMKVVTTGKYEQDLKISPILVASLVIRALMPTTSVIEICWLSGTGGKDLAHQLLQYIKNNILILENQ